MKVKLTTKSATVLYPYPLTLEPESRQIRKVFIRSPMLENNSNSAFLI
jgi:hypothetical protein